jgi:hypothetical protein
VKRELKNEIAKCRVRGRFGMADVVARMMKKSSEPLTIRWLVLSARKASWKAKVSERISAFSPAIRNSHNIRLFNPSRHLLTLPQFPTDLQHSHRGVLRDGPVTLDECRSGVPCSNNSRSTVWDEISPDIPTRLCEASRGFLHLDCRL